MGTFDKTTEKRIYFFARPWLGPSYFMIIPTCQNGIVEVCPPFNPLHPGEYYKSSWIRQYLQMAVIILPFYISTNHNDVIKWNHFPRYWPFVRDFTGPGELPAQRPVTRSFNVFFYLRLNKRLSKQRWGWWFETPSWSLWRHCNNRRISLKIILTSPSGGKHKMYSYFLLFLDTEFSHVEKILPHGRQWPICPTVKTIVLTFFTWNITT